MTKVNRVAIVGVGLLGGSIGKALKSRNLASEIIGVGRREESLTAAVQCGAIDRYELTVEKGCYEADIVIVCTPVQQIVPSICQSLPHLAAGGWISDVGSTKQTICEGLGAADHQAFCGAHPLAGSDKSGVQHADANLFVQRHCILTPVPATPPELTSRVDQFWKSLGCKTSIMTPSEHDRVLAHTSHLPHILAAAIAASTPGECLPLVASGWCDTTRIAAGNVELWRQIIAENRQPILAALNKFSGALSLWVDAIADNDDYVLEKLLNLGKQKRDSVAN